MAVGPEGLQQDDAWQEKAQALMASGAPFDAHWQAYQEVFAGRAPEDGPPQVWRPSGRSANLEYLLQRAGVEDMDALHAWSARHRDLFWGASLERIGAVYQVPPREILTGDAVQPSWLAGAHLNAAQTCFQAPEDRVAIRFGDEAGLRRDVTYGQLRRLADQVSLGLEARGLVAGDAVALYLPMNIECVAAYLGIVQAGMVVVSIPDSFAPDEVATRLRLGRAKAIITVDAMQRGGKLVPMRPKAIEAAGERIVISIGDAPPQREQDVRFEDLLVDGTYRPVACHPQDTTNILFSSGTTGEPKAIPWTHLTPFKAAIDGHWHQDIQATDSVAWPTNIGWMMGPWLIYATFMNQATMVLYEGVPTGERFVRFLRDARVTVLGLVPAIVRAWAEAGTPPGSLPDVRVFSSTGEASNVHDYLYLMSLAGYQAPIIEYCGGTEIGGGHLTGSVIQPASPATFTTPALGIDFVLIGDDGIVEGPGMGEIFLIPPSMGLSQRLLNRDHDKEYYADCPSGPDGVVLRRHGDEVQRLHQGFYIAHGRADDTMNLGGIKVSSIELERVMNDHPAVFETAAVGIPPQGGGAERLVVFAVLHGERPDALQAELQLRIKQHLNPLFRIHDVVLVDSLPRTASNKVMRRSLRAEYPVTA